MKFRDLAAKAGFSTTKAGNSAERPAFKLDTFTPKGTKTNPSPAPVHGVTFDRGGNTRSWFMGFSKLERVSENADACRAALKAGLVVEDLTTERFEHVIAYIKAVAKAVEDAAKK